MSTLTQEALTVLEQTNYIACLCTTTSEGLPSGRFVKAVPSRDHTKLFVGNRKLNGAIHHLEKKPQAMFVISDRVNDPLKAHAYQIDCTLDEHRIMDEDNPIFQYVAEATKDELSRPESTFLSKLIYQTQGNQDKTVLQELLKLANKLEHNGMKEVLSFSINHVFNCALRTEQAN